MGKKGLMGMAGGLLALGLCIGLAKFRPAARPHLSLPVATARVILITRLPTPSHPPSFLPSPSPSPTRTPRAQRMVITGTGGIGLRLRKGPGLLYPVVTILKEGTSLRAFPDSVEADGLRWRRVQTEDGAFEGWVAESYLAPAE